MAHGSRPLYGAFPPIGHSRTNIQIAERSKRRRHLISIEDQASQLKQPPSLHKQQTHQHTRITECLFLFPHPPHRFMVRIVEDFLSLKSVYNFILLIYQTRQSCHDGLLIVTIGYSSTSSHRYLNTRFVVCVFVTMSIVTLVTFSFDVSLIVSIGKLICSYSYAH